MMNSDQKTIGMRLTAGVALLVMLFLLAGCGPYIQDAVRGNDAVQLRQMIARGADPMKTGFKDETLLHLAANHNAVETARLLIQSGVKIDARDKDGRTPLHLAAFRGFAETSALLVAHGADPTLADNRGQTPLHLARIGGDPLLVMVMMPDDGGLADRWFVIGNRLAEEGQCAAALQAYHLELESNGEDERVYYNIGLCHLRLEQIDAALAAFQSAARLDHDYAKAYYNMGVIFGGQGRYDEAVAAFRETLRIDPADGEAWYNLGNCYDGLHQDDDALKAWESALLVAPEMPAPRFNMALTLSRLGHHDRARRHYDALKRSHPDMAAELASLLPLSQ